MEYEVTIGIPVYNAEKYIRKALESALSQAFQSVEILICDDCGTDSSIDIVREYQAGHQRGGDIHIVRQPCNKGIGEARNLIVDLAKGKYLYFMDADDVITENAISLLYENARKYGADIVYGSHNRVEEFDSQVLVKPYVYPSKVFLEDDAFACWAYEKYSRVEAMTWNMLIRVSVFRENGIRYQPISYWEDMTLTIDLPTYVSRVVLLPDITYQYQCRYGSLSNFQERDRISKDEILDTIWAMEMVKGNSWRIKDKPYYPKRCLKVMTTCFYMACSVIKNRRKTHPPFSSREIRALMASPLHFAEILRFRSAKWQNLALYMLGVLPSALSVLMIWLIGKKKGLI